MNDFTKDELIWLEEEIRLGQEEYRQPNISYEVHKKVQSMIENYCEHNNNKHIGREEIRKAFCCGKELFYSHVNWSIAKCGDCGRKLNE